MFRPITSLTDNEKLQEIEDLEKLLVMSKTANVDSLLHKEIDTKLLKLYNLTLTPNGEFFDVSKQGFLAEIMETMWRDRNAYKKKALKAMQQLEKETDPIKRKELENEISKFNNLQLAKKVCLNSAYGALGNEYCRWFDVRQASAITTAGQLAIQWIAQRLNQYLNKILKTENKDYVIASDTDSVYLTLDELVKQTFSVEPSPVEVIAFMDRVCEQKLQPFIERSFKELSKYLNCFEQKMYMKREVLADKGLWTAKKRYALRVYNSEGVQYATPKVKISGLEMVKSSTPAACREKLKQSLDIILSGTNEDLIQFIETFKEEFKSLSPGDIAFPRGVNGIRDYTDRKTMLHTKGTPIHVRGAINYNRLIKQKHLEKDYPMIKEGEKIKFLYLKEPNRIGSNIISFPQVIPKEFDLDKFIDYNTQYDKSFLEPLKIILDCIGWKTEKVSSLSSFFS